jgi:hypothetical protein
MCIVCLFLIRQNSILVQPTVRIGNAIFLGAYVIGAVFLVLSCCRACCCTSVTRQLRVERMAKRCMASPPVLQVTKRQLLQRFWIVLRLCSIVFGLFALLLYLTPEFEGGVLDSTYGDNERAIRSGSYLAVGLSYILVGLVMQQSLRAAVVLFLGRRTKTGGSKEAEAAFVSSLIHHKNHFTAVDAYAKACELFRAFPGVCLSTLEPEQPAGTVRDPCHACVPCSLGHAATLVPSLCAQRRMFAKTWSTQTSMVQVTVSSSSAPRYWERCTLQSSAKSMPSSPTQHLTIP